MLHSFNSYVRSRYSAPRGAALVTTVLLAVIGATIALTSLWVALSRTRAAAAERDLSTAQVSLFSALDEYEARLIDDPYYFLNQVDRYERARVCTGAEIPRVVEPGAAWPRECGATWSYVDPQLPGVTRPQPARLVVTPPSSADPFLNVQAVSTSGASSLARERTYSLDAASSMTLYSEEDLRFDEIIRPTTTALEVSGDIYTAGKLALSTNAGVTLSEGLLMAEEGFYPASAVTPSETLRWFCATMPDNTATPADADTLPDPCPIATVGVEDIREVNPAPLRVNALADDVARLYELACAPSVKGAAAINVVTSRVDHLCIEPGSIMTDTAGTDRTVPVAAETYLLLFSSAAGSQRVTVWAVNRGPSFVQDCLISCSLPILAETERLAGSHIGDLSFWSDTDLNGNGSISTSEQGTLIGTFFVPESGIIYVGGDTSIGLCGSAFTVAGGTCDPSTVSTMVDSVTVVAGDRQSPADIYISAPITVDTSAVGGDLRLASGRLGLIATRYIFLPYWARPPGGDLTIEASLLALGIGADYGSGRFRGAVSSVPAVVHEGYPGNENNQGNLLTLTGSVAGEAVDLSTNQYLEVIIRQDPRLLTDSPAYFPSFNGIWDLRSVQDLSPEDVCGSFDCTAWTAN